METVVLIILLLVSLSFILKLTFHRPAGVAVLSLLTMAFTVFMTESASSQSKTRIADWLSQPELMLDTSVVLTIDVAFQICFCILMASRLSGTLRGLQSILLEITLWIPGLLLFPTLYSMLVAIIFSMPGADFDTIGWISGTAVMTATPVLAYGLKFILPETDLRLELIFLINLLIATLGIVATVNGRTAATGTNNVEWQALAAIFAIIISGLCAGWIYFRVRNSKKINNI